MEEQLWYYSTHSGRDKGVHNLPQSIRPKVNVISRLEFEPFYCDVAIRNVNHYTESPLRCKCVPLKLVLNVTIT